MSSTPPRAGHSAQPHVPAPAVPAGLAAGLAELGTGCAAAGRSGRCSQRMHRKVTWTLGLLAKAVHGADCSGSAETRLKLLRIATVAPWAHFWGAHMHALHGARAARSGAACRRRGRSTTWRARRGCCRRGTGSRRRSRRGACGRCRSGRRRRSGAGARARSGRWRRAMSNNRITHARACGPCASRREARKFLIYCFT